MHRPPAHRSRTGNRATCPRRCPTRRCQCPLCLTSHPLSHCFREDDNGASDPLTILPTWVPTRGRSTRRSCPPNTRRNTKKGMAFRSSFSVFRVIRGHHTHQPSSPGVRLGHGVTPLTLKTLSTFTLISTSPKPTHHAHLRARRHSLALKPLAEVHGMDMPVSVTAPSAPSRPGWFQPCSVE